MAFMLLFLVTPVKGHLGIYSEIKEDILDFQEYIKKVRNISSSLRNIIRF
jgi:hypothetical protein